MVSLARTVNVRKASALILATIYLSFAVGVTVHQHYCMGELVGASLFSLRGEACGKCGMEKHTEASKDCCKDTSIIIKADDSHTFSQAIYDVNSQTFILPDIHFVSGSLSIQPTQIANLYRAHSPPLLNQSLFLLFGNFRI